MWQTDKDAHSTVAYTAQHSIMGVKNCYSQFCIYNQLCNYNLKQAEISNKYASLIASDEIVFCSRHCVPAFGRSSRYICVRVSYFLDFLFLTFLSCCILFSCIALLS